ncbi:hypothetical protein [Luteibacter sp. ME-Dv--P-043b]|uniref:hypothetical protein n=1 Tax=Luteibacter sp. ME-Dv--P-043b TaxID=3040291 RepID=UPI002557BF68|nr:hypothetical protein [Luteibacter sp. ME-Dv--P-043b]
MPILNGVFAGLPAPLIHEVENNGGLGVRDVGEGAVAPVTVIVGPWDLFKDGDQAQILWGADQVLVGERDMSATDANKSIPVPVSPERIRALGDGVHDVFVRVVSALGNPQVSPPLTVRVKMKRPGGIDTQPDTETINENLAVALVHPSPLIDDISDVQVVVPSYENVAEGDRIRASWHGKFVDLPPLTSDDVGKSEFDIPIDEETIRSAGGGDAQITYRILDLVSNNSLWAPYRVVDVPIDDPDAPTSPWVDGTVDDAGLVLRLADLDRSPVTVLAEAHGGRAGEHIFVRWVGVAAGEQPVPLYDTAWQSVTHDNGTLTFQVPYEQAEVLGEGRVSVSYTLERKSGARVVSRRRSIRVEGKAVGLDLPRVEGTPGKVLDAAAHPDGALIAAPSQPERIPAGSLVTFRWSGNMQGAASGYADGVNDTHGVLPYEDIIQLVGGQVRISYQVETFGTDNAVFAISESDAVTLDVVNSAAAPDLSPPSVPEAINGVLPLNTLLAHLVIPRLTRGTSVEANIQGRVPFKQTIPIGNPAQPPSFNLTSAGFIQPNANSQVSATYTVTAPGYSATSSAYNFVIGSVASLPAPRVPESSDGVLDPFYIGGAIEVDVPFDSNDFHVGDTVTVSVEGVLGDTRPTWSDSRALTADDLKDPIVFQCPVTTLQPVDGGRAMFQYSITAANGIPRPSEILTLAVQRALRGLRAPTVQQAEGSRLDPFDALNGIRVLVPANSSIKDTDTVTVAWADNTNGSDPRGSYVTAEQSGRPGGMTFTVPSSVLPFNFGDQVSVTYTVVRNGARSTSPTAFSRSFTRAQQ